EHYLQRISERVGSSLGALTTKLSAAPVVNARLLKQPKKTGSVQQNRHIYQDHLLALAWTYPELRDAFAKLKPDYFEGEVRRAIAEQLLTGAQGLQSDDFRVKIQELELIVEAKYPTLTDQLYFIASDIAKKIKKEQKIRVRAQLKHAFTNAQTQAEQQQLSNAIKQLDQAIEALNH
ncbi:MAG TPA: hypothetical protein VFT87_04885, partial [Candidatus Saccharimonadales bacterium]|nr:hypothetical protein [Candidatus Saccharimonadales bacterium]